MKAGAFAFNTQNKIHSMRLNKTKGQYFADQVIKFTPLSIFPSASNCKRKGE
jgi:hypothetical protein